MTSGFDADAVAMAATIDPLREALSLRLTEHGSTLVAEKSRLVDENFILARAIFSKLIFLAHPTTTRSHLGPASSISITNPAFSAFRTSPFLPGPHKLRPFVSF